MACVFRILLTLLLFSGAANAAAPKVFSEVRQAIEDAKKGEKLIVFMLVDVRGFREEGEALEELILDELKKRGDEFVVVRCNANNEAHVKMFTDRFKKDLTKAPIAVVSNAKGEEITGCYGVDGSMYEKMLTLSRIKGGKVTDEKELVELRVGLLEGDSEAKLVESIFGVMLEDLKGKKVLLSEVRDWTYKKGGGFRAALLAGRGETGLFIDAKGEEIEAKFAELSEPDIEFLKTILRFEETETKEENNPKKIKK
ncbi:hypothetical protein OAE25_01185 [Verrucomicrobiales bacterium]|mgnify:CR=1 FL=1|jgi:hypothetical protein|nr:hypothetical protein [Verrucomicrobiales bacterium]MDC0322477.1 hypothetical protein [Verrucomicrobiales bacterium]